jgi:hypothetical protein
VVLREKVARVDADVDAVVSMQIQPRTTDKFPYMEIRLVQGQQCNDCDGETWDVALAA